MILLEKKGFTQILEEKGTQISLFKGWVQHQLISGFFPYRSAEKRFHADFRRNGSADCLIDLLDLAPIDQRVFSV